MCGGFIKKIPLPHPALPCPGRRLLRSYQVLASVSWFMTTPAQKLLSLELLLPELFPLAPEPLPCSALLSEILADTLLHAALPLSPLHFPSPLAPCCYHGPTVLYVQVIQKYNRTFQRGQDLNSLGSQSSPSAPLNLKQSIQ